MKKKKLCLTVAEWRYILHSLNALKTKLHSEGQHTDTVDDALLAVMNAKTKMIKVA